MGLTFNVLLDPCSTGSEGYIINYVHTDVVHKLEEQEKLTKKKALNKCTCLRATTCTAAGCFETSSCKTMYIKLFDDNKTLGEEKISFRVAKGIQHDMIIGNHTFRSLDLSKEFRHLFAPIEEIKEVAVNTTDSPTEVKQVMEKQREESTSQKKSTFGQIRASARLSAKSSRLLDTDSLVNDLNERQLGNLWLNNIILTKEELLDEEDTEDYEDDIPSNPIEEFLNNNPTNWDEQTKEENVKDLLTRVHNSELKMKILPLLNKHLNVFRQDLPKEPAKIEPMKLKLIEGSDWYINRKNKQRPRLQVIAKQYALRKFTLKAITNGLIRPSNATSWSHPHLTTKPNGEYRVCMDWKSLNKETLMNGWPLLNIKDIIHRLGEKKATYFAVIDLTQGYWQIPICDESQHLTAFRTAEGLYEWTRLGMGLKGAGPYFQYHMANTIFPDLIYKSLEVYLDDIITWGETHEELLENLQKIFSKLQEFNVFINPNKIKIGMSEVEYVGHVIDRHGQSFSQMKQDQVLNFRKPKTVKDMKSFLGVISQFRDHVDHFGDITSPLYALTNEYDKVKHNQIKWNGELEQAYENVKSKVANCPKLFFLNDKDPIYLNTDASNIGIGAYLYQVVEAKKFPIKFISKALSKTERRWDTVEKEAFAIFYALQKLKYLLHDRTFTIQTDSKNLSYMNAENKSQKVQRWKLSCQEFDFKVEHIPGEVNIEADGFSRLVEIPSDQVESALEL